MGACTSITLPKVIASGSVPGTSASPGFQYGRAGNVTAPTYLQVVATVPSNTAGLIVPFTGFITGFWSTNEDPNTYGLQVQERTGAAFNDLTGALLNVVADRKLSINIAIPVTKGWELVIYVVTGFGRNIQAGIIIEQAS